MDRDRDRDRTRAPPLCLLLAMAACSSTEGAAPAEPRDAGPTATDASGDGPASVQDAGSDAAAPVDALRDNRTRLLSTYLGYLKAHPAERQSNGLSGSELGTVCDLWTKLDPSSRATFLTITARLQGTRLAARGESALVHVTRLYRAVGGQGATPSAPGSCGGGEYNRLVMSADATLHAALLAAHAHQGKRQPDGTFDLADIPADTAFRNSTDAAGPHAPFDRSDESTEGAPRGQLHYFADPTSTLAASPLGRMDLSLLADPYALEMDQDYDCVHNSNPSCTYITYGKLCTPKPSALGTTIYESTYGTTDPTYTPCN